MLPVTALCACVGGCSVAGTDFQPGVAAEVGDSSLTTDHVDTLSLDYCDAIASRLQNPISLQQLRSNVVSVLSADAAARQVAAQYHVTAGSDYQRSLTTLKAAVAALPADQQQAVLEIEGSQTLVSSVVLAVGRQVLQQRGATIPDNAKAASSAESQAGQKALTTWVTDHEVRIDPRYGLSAQDGTITTDDPALSTAVSTTALDSALTDSNPDAAADLPENQRCG